MTRAPKDVDQKEALERMNKALKAALETPPKKHKDELRRREKKGKAGMTKMTLVKLFRVKAVLWFADRLKVPVDVHQSYLSGG